MKQEKPIYNPLWWYIEFDKKDRAVPQIFLMNDGGCSIITYDERFSWVKLKTEIDSPIGMFIPLGEPDIIFVGSPEILEDRDFLRYTIENEIVVVNPWQGQGSKKLVEKIKTLCYERMGKEA